MAHAITLNRKTNKSEMAYAGDTPWHGLGQALSAGADIDTWKAEAGMAWAIKKAFPRFAPYRDAPEADWVKHEDHVILFRDDTQQSLSIVSPSYKIVQPGEVLEFFRDLVGPSGFTLETAGTLDGGRRFWAMANIGDEAEVTPGDRVKGRLLLASSCDGSTQTIGKFISERVVCANTLAIAMGENGNAIKMSHRSKFSAEKMKRDLNIGHGQFRKFMDAARHLSEVHLSAADSESLLVKILSKPVTDINAEADFAMSAESDLQRLLQRKPTAKAEPTVQEGKQFKGIMDLYNGQGMGSMLPGSQGTAWGLLNAVTQTVDWSAPAHSQNNRLKSAWFGAGDELKTKALETLLAV